MKKYLRCFKENTDITVGKRYEIVGETMCLGDKCYVIIDDAGDRNHFPIDPDREGESYRDWFTLEFVPEISADITVLADESLGGIEHEYREVKRKAAVGERIKIVSADNTGGAYVDGDVFTVDDYAGGYEDTGHVVVESIANSGNYDGQIDAWEYVVLEPTDIIRIDNERLRMVDRKATVGERVIITNPGIAVKTGEVITVNKGAEIDDSGIAYIDGRRGTYGGGKYRVLEPVKTAPLSAQPPFDQAAANIAALIAKVQALESRVATLEAANQPVKVAEGPADDAPPSFAFCAHTPQQLRDEIVERAKADVKAPLDRNYPDILESGVWFSERGWITVTDECEFVVDRDKRTVVALIRELESGKKSVLLRGIAKAAPNDVFNAHIGRAIAVRRALGLEVPAEYLNVPNPEEPRVGDYVMTFGCLDFTITWDGSAASVSRLLRTGEAVILDDSREEVGA